MLPTPAPLLQEELLFSGLGRLSALNALTNIRDALARLTGGRSYRVSADLPCHLLSILNLVGVELAAHSVDALIEHHTLFPYYRFFSPWERWLRVRDIALTHDAGRLKATMGILAHGVRATPILRYCPLCICETRLFIWQRCHHLPGVVACAKHGCLLVFTLSQAQLGFRARLRSAPQLTGLEPVMATAAQRELALVSRDILLYEGAHIAPSAIRRAYAIGMVRQSWKRRSGSPVLEPLIESMRSRLGNALGPDLATRFRLVGSGPMPWVRELLSARERACSPLAHVMLIYVLFETVELFVEACHEQAADSASAVPSNASAAASGSPSRFERAGLAVADLSRSCTQVAEEFDVSVGWVVKQRRIVGLAIRERFKSLDKECIAKIKASLAKGESVSQVARRCKLSPSTVYRVLSYDPELINSRSASLLQSERKRHRAKWLRLISGQQARGTQALREHAPNCYSWLFRNDRAWLQAHRPTRLRRRPPNRVDWPQRDAELARRVEMLPAVTGVHEERLRSQAGVVSLVYSPSSMSKHADKLPKFAQAAKARAAAEAIAKKTPPC